ncbi:MAG: hypothetical protein VYC34_01730, partial [Planctomycetota bacterium]|nr:hypothetical protein [Planctomycetota bacterium]
FMGVLASYDWMTTASEAIQAGDEGAPSGFLFFATYVILPLVTLVSLFLVTLRFSAGIEQGVIATSVSELDEKLDREISQMKISAGSMPRAVGALSRAFGDDVNDSIAPSLQRGHDKPVRERKASADDLDRPLSKGSPGDPLRRPI